MRERTGVRVFRWLARRFPAAMRSEVVTAFGAVYERRLAEAGRWRAVLYLWRAGWDVVRAGRKERRRQAAARSGSEREGGAMSGLWWDVRYAVRVLARSPGLAATVVLVLALGIGANTAVFGALRAVVLRPAAYPEVDRLVFPKIAWQRGSQPDTSLIVWSYPKYERLVEGTAGVFEGIGGYSPRRVSLTGLGPAEQIEIELATPSYFRLLGVEAAVGRTFGPDEAEPSSDPGVAVIGYELWSTRFAGSPEAIGAEVRLNGEALRVVGVMPRGFRGLRGKAEAWVSMADADEVLGRTITGQKHAHWMHALARLSPGVTLADARARVRQVGADIEAELPLGEPGAWVGAELLSFEHVYDNPSARASLLVLTAAALLVLLLAAANLAGLLLARASRRARESAVRLAVGASRWRLVRGLLTETLLLALVGGAAGLLVAYWGIHAIAAAWPDRFVTGQDAAVQVVDVAQLGLDVWVVLFALGVTVGTALLFGLLPAMRQSAVRLVPALKKGSGSGTRAGLGTRRALVAGQMAIALVLLVGAGLMLRTFVELQSVPLGYDPDRLLVAGYAADVGDDGDPWSIHSALLERVRSIPGVRAATLGSDAPQAGWSSITRVSRVEGRPPIPEGQGPMIGALMAAPDWFDVVDAPIVEGRGLTSADGVFPPGVVVINRTAALELFGDEPALGREFSMGLSFTPDGGTYRVVGVVDDILHGRPQGEAVATAYMPLEAAREGRVALLVRTDGDPLDVVPAVRQALATVAPDTPLYGITTAQDLGIEAVGDTRVVLALLLLFAVIALVLAATGTYGVVAYSVAERRSEIGLRMALGAPARRVAGMLLRQGLATGILGIGLGLALAWAGTRVLASLLFGVSERDPLILAAGGALLLLTALLASWLPARRAMRIDPVRVLKSE